MRKLLEGIERDEEESKKNPLFYNMQQNINGVMKTLTPIQIVLEANQVAAAGTIIDYIVKY